LLLTYLTNAVKLMAVSIRSSFIQKTVKTAFSDSFCFKCFGYLSVNKGRTVQLRTVNSKLKPFPPTGGKDL